jgi:hypothetical protein
MKWNSFTAGDFMYGPLNECRGEIRLLSFTHLEPDESGVISCLLETRSLQDELRYTALSYAWGDPQSTETILVNGSAFQTTPNLVDALSYIRKHMASGSLSHELPRLFWIDAICIDQTNNAEKAHQVGMMRNIYASATNVLSWLGYGDSSVLSAFDFMRNVVAATYFRSGTSKKENQQLNNGSIIQPESTQDGTSIDTIVDPRLIFLFSRSESVIDFFSLRYWHRIWIVQEVVLANPEGNALIYGDEVITFSDVQIFRDTWLTFLKALQLNPEWESTLSRSPGLDSNKSLSWAPYLQRMEESLVVWSYYDFMRGLSASGGSLFYIILACAYNKTDPRDAVFALVGMVSHHRLQVDYAQCTAHVYTTWFISVLEDWQDLQPLYFSGIDKISTVSGLPSWVPDLSSRRTDSPVWDATLSRTIEEDSLPTNLLFGNQTTPAFPRTDMGILYARGILFDDVVEVRRIDFPHAPEEMAQFCTVYMSDEERKFYRTGIPALQAIFRVLMCGINRFSSSDSESEASLISRDLQVSVGTNEIQLNGSMPLLQPVAKFMLLKGSFSTEHSDDFVLKALCMTSSPLGTRFSSDVQLAAAFVVFLITGESQGLSSALLRSLLTLSSSSNLQHTFLECFFPDKRVELEHLLSNDLFQDEKVMSLVNCISRYFKVYDHTFFFTSTGYLGNGPPSMAAGDRVVVFEGAKMPFIVRKSDRGFVLVGPCYAEGLSNGEPAAMARRGEVSVEVIQLC